MNKISNYKNFVKRLNESYINDSDLVGMIDYTLLKPEADEIAIVELCNKAKKLGVKSVCVLPKMVRIAAKTLEDSPILVCTVVSFPHGTDTPQQKLAETKQCLSDGADEVDMVLDYPKLKNLFANMPDIETEEGEEQWNTAINQLAFDDVSPLVDECHSHTNKDGNPVTLKVIVESGLLTDDEIEEATHICLEAGADFIKTSTGMVAVGAEIGAVKIMRRVINEEGSDMKIKASGGLRTLADLKKFAPYVDRFGVGFGAVDSIFGDSNIEGDGY